MKVQVYFNLHKKLWSIKSMDKQEDYGRVVAHADIVALGSVTGHVSQKGRERVLKERKKNVHAGLRGQLLGHYKGKTYVNSIKNAREITYNPYKFNSFVYVDTGEPFEYSDRAFLADKRVFVL